MPSLGIWLPVFMFSFFAVLTNVHRFRRLSRPQAVKIVGSKSVYYIEDGSLHHIPDWSTFVSLGYDVDDIKTITADELASYPVGEPAGQIIEDKIPDSPLKNCPCVSASGYAATQSMNSTANKHHLICFVESKETDTLMKTFDTSAMQLHYKVISESLYDQNYRNYTKLHGNITDCDVIIKLTSMVDSNVKYSCPELCVPKPYTELPLSLLMPSASQFNISGDTTVTCSMTMDVLFAEGSALHHHHKHSHSHNHSTATESTISPDHKPSGHAHLSTAMILKAVAKRRIEECSERYYWSNGGSTGGALDTSFVAPVRRKVHGLIIWTGSRSRYDLSEDQIQVLRNSSLSADSTVDNVVVGWMATEDQYPCRVGSSLCETATSSNAYYHYMPSTRLNFASAGWGCAQRRPLRALAHTLLLYDPNFLLIVDDDTYVSMTALHKMDPYIRGTLMKEALVLGQLTMGKKITKKGFYYGGAGYMIGRVVIERLTAYELAGPGEAFNKMIDPTQMAGLSVFNQAAELSKDVCPDCMVLHPGSVVNEINTRANISVRMVEMCVNIMSQEHTCYHSDHAISRCFIHGTNAFPMAIECGGSALGGGVTIGMCMGTDNCATTVHLTCHRWRPTNNTAIPRNMYA